MNERLDIQALGGLTVFKGGMPVTGFASRKVPALLVYLACNPRHHSREVLAELLWSERSQTRSLANLRVVLSSLREQLEPFVEISRQTVAFNTSSFYYFDVTEMDSLISTGRAQWAQYGRVSRAVVQSLDKAVELYEGDFLEGFYVRDGSGYDDWVTLERERIRRQIIESLDTIAQYYLESDAEGYVAGRNPRFLGVEYANRALHFDPLREESHRLLMMLHAKLGQRAKAVAQYEKCRAILYDELGVEPSEETVDLYHQIESGEIREHRGPTSLHTKPITVQASHLHPEDDTEKSRADVWAREDPYTGMLNRPKQKSQQPPVPLPQPVRRPRVCRYCQHELPDDALKCPNCGNGAKTTVSLGYIEPEDGDTHFDDESVLLIHFFGFNEPLRIPVPFNEEVLLGRTEDGIDLTPLQGLEHGVSRVHALLKRQGDTLTILDMDSSNGSFINGQRLYAHEVRVLRHGDELRLGKLVSRIRFYRP